MCEGDGCNCDMKCFLTVCFCFKLCCDVADDASKSSRGSMASNDDLTPLTGDGGVQPDTPEMSRFKF